MFRNPKEAGKLIEAVNNNKDYIINIPNKQNNKNIEKEIYVIGVKDNIIFTINGDEKGYKLENNEWKEFNNKDEKFLGKDENNDFTILSYRYKTELSQEMVEFAQEITRQDSLSEEFTQKLLILQNTFKISDNTVKDYILNPITTKEEIEAFAKELEAKELAEAKELNKSKDKDDDDNVRRMDRMG
ncbi:MAG: hypothetical protein LBJ88_05430 [Campylobacteraceae bacterium]|jgi:lipopolysaccharide export LptBFGC system permease protein LptF|nr:hypothetical protein [Campylobacteraceae bacterium]